MKGGRTAREIRLDDELQYTKLYCPRKSFPWGLGRRRRAMRAYIGGAVTFGECGFPGARKNNIVQERTSKAVLRLAGMTFPPSQSLSSSPWRMGELETEQLLTLECKLEAWSKPWSLEKSTREVLLYLIVGPPFSVLYWYWVGRENLYNISSLAPAAAQFGIELSGHHDIKSFKKDNRSEKEIQERAMQQIVDGEMVGDRLITWKEDFEMEMKHFEEIKKLEVVPVPVETRECWDDNCNAGIRG
ncbi:unnamed protein product [Calypogeia fissa]